MCGPCGYGHPAYADVVCQTDNDAHTAEANDW